MELKQLIAQLRLDCIRTGLHRIRVAFLVTNIAAAAMFIAGWNTYFSRTRDFVKPAEVSGNTLAAAVQRENIAQILQGEVVTVALLGIRARVVDFAVLGSLGMLVCACWMLLGLRGHHANVLRLLDDTRDDRDLDFRRWIAHGIDSLLVFSALRPSTQSTGSRVWEWFNRALWYVPATITGLIVCSDFYAAFSRWTSPCSVSGVLRTAREQNPRIFYSWEIAAIILGVLTFLLCKKMASYDKSSDGLVLQYFSEIRAIEEPPTPGP